MKQKLYTTLFSLSCLVTTAFAQEQPKPTELPAGVKTDWYNNAVENLQAKEYGFYAQKGETFFAANKKNHLSFMISNSGYSVKSAQLKAGQQAFEIGFNLQHVGRDKSIAVSGSDFSLVQNNNSIVYQSKKLNVEYVNDAQGMRQNFIIKEKMSGTGNLHIDLQLNSDLAATIKNNSQLVFNTRGNNNDIQLIYDDLKVWDANHQALSAHFELDNTATSLSIIVDDKNAAYPVTIDPLNRTPEWTTSADGVLPGLLNNLQLQVQTMYGYSVASLGDVNGDGFDDVAVSAPTMADVISGTGSLTGVGAVFIYLGSPTGLPANPNKVLQPTTAVDGAMFGFSISAGDITGDGKSDIVISAPLDRYQTMAEGLLGATSVNVTAGKVYIYRSEDLFSAPNPTPFLQIRLQGTTMFSTGVLGLLLSNVDVNALFGYTVAVAPDLNGDGKADLIIGAPSYVGVDILSVQSGAAFIYYSNNLGTTNPVQLDVPTPTILGLITLPVANLSGLLFGYSVDAAGDYNGDGNPDVVVGAPAGADLSSLGTIFTGQVLGGSAYVYFGTGTGINSAIGAKLQAGPSGLLGNAANLFGYKVKGVRSAFDINNGNILVSAPVGSVLSNVVGGLRVKAGQVNLFKKNLSVPVSPSTGIIPTQVLSSPRASTILGILVGQTINVSLMYGFSLDNMLDVNCDGFGDIIVGEPLSSAVPVIGANVTGGSAYVYLGKADGTYNAAPFWDLTTSVTPLLGVNATALVGFSVAGARHTKGSAQGVRSLIGGPSNSLDFGSGLLNLGNTFNTLTSFTFDNNGLGKAYTFAFSSCNITLPSTLLDFKGQVINKTVALSWTAVNEDNVNLYELQHSTDGIQFETMAIAFAKNSQRNEYSYLDKHPIKGVNYYRLKTVDKDTRVTYSAVVTARFDEKLAGDVVVAPNPVRSNDIGIKMTGLEKGVYHVELINSVGQVQATKTINVIQFEQKENIHVDTKMSSGLYWLSIYNESNNRVKMLGVFVNKE